MCGDDRGWRPAPHIGDKIGCSPQTVLSAAAGEGAERMHRGPWDGQRGRTSAHVAWQHASAGRSNSLR
eukprot:5392563-Prymnesium_polylepis.1